MLTLILLDMVRLPMPFWSLWPTAGSASADRPWRLLVHSWRGESASERTAFSRGI